MTTTLTTRLGLYRWSDDTDLWSRAQFTQNMDRLEERVAAMTLGTLAALPSASAAASVRKLYLATDTEQLFVGDGDEWHEVPLLTTAAPQTFAGNVIAPNFKLTTRNDVGTAAPVGTGTAYARGDKVWNTQPSASGVIGWVCTAAGSPGTWKTFGAISA